MTSISASGIVKTFGPVVANRDASLDVAGGEIHAIVGENGAGKSTLMRILAGVFPPDAGTVRIDGRDVTGWSTREAIAAGVGMVHQHFMLVPTLTVAENLVLGREITKGLRLDREAAEQEVRSLCERTGLVVAANRLVAELSVGEAQRVEILKVLWRGAKILILDEPTAVLSPPEVKELWRVLRRLRESGDAVVLITHKLDEVIEISDTVTVMRAGATVGRVATKDASPAMLAKMMVGRDVALVGEAVALGTALDQPSGGERHPRESERQPRESGDLQPRRAVAGDSSVRGKDVGSATALSVRNLTVATTLKPRAVDDVSFELATGEILGIAGVEGNGQTELIEAIAGLRRPTAGQILLGSRDVTGASVRDRADAGLSHVPEDRHLRGLVLDYSIADNLILGQQHRFTARGALDRARVLANAGQQVEIFDIRPPNAALSARALSGGNQQKVVVAREMGRSFNVLLAAQPTRGVDVGAIEFIHAQLRAARDARKAVLLVSADLAEVLALADRVAVMYGGRIVAMLPRDEATSEVVGRYMTGAS